MNWHPPEEEERQSQVPGTLFLRDHNVLCVLLGFAMPSAVRHQRHGTFILRDLAPSQ